MAETAAYLIVFATEALPAQRLLLASVATWNGLQSFRRNAFSRGNLDVLHRVAWLRHGQTVLAHALDMKLDHLSNFSFNLADGDTRGHASR